VNYHDRPEVSASMLKSMLRGWRVFESEYVTRTAEREETDAMRFGTAVHTALLEPSEMWARYAVPPQKEDHPEAIDTVPEMRAWLRDAGVKGTSKLDKAGLAAAIREADPSAVMWDNVVDIFTRDKIILSLKDRQRIERISANAYADPAVRELLETPGSIEQEVYWDHHSAHCRMRYDKAIADVVIDVKTIKRLQGDDFAREIASRHYDIQAAHYMEGLDAREFIFIACETAEPFRVQAFHLSYEDLDRANERRDELLIEHSLRKETGDWSEQGEGKVTTVFLPNWRG
jgi:exodeoxyribonuclease VIII